jgi:uncharacterized protein YndB with AHSA1/START domain
MIKHDFTLEIKAPIEKVFAFATDLRNNSKWQDDVQETTQTPDGPTQLGTKFRTVRTVFGQRLDATGEVTEFVPNQRFAFKAASGPMHITFAQSFEAIPGGTKTSVHVEAEPGGVFKLAEGALAGQMKQQFESQSQKLKAVLEA